jgi:hypothetical protein
MTKEQLEERKTFLKSRIKKIEQKIVDEQDKAKERELLDRLSLVKSRLDEINKKLAV